MPKEVVCPACGEHNSYTRSSCWVCTAPLEASPVEALPGAAKRGAGTLILQALGIGCGLMALLIVLFVVTCFAAFSRMHIG